MKEKIANILIEENYKLLDLEPGASDSEIEEAYEKIKKICRANSIASHSLFSPEEKKAILEKATRAYEALKFQRKQSGYSLKEVLKNHNEERHDFKKKLHNGEESISDIRIDFKLRKNEAKIKKPLIVLSDPKSLAAEQYRFLCTKLEQISVNKNHNVFAVTSAVKGEGKSTTSINLAYLMAHEFKKKVLLVDGDMRSPSMLHYLEIKKDVGLADILKGGLDASAVLYTLLDSNLAFLPSSNTTKSPPMELLSSLNMKRLMSSFKTQFDYVLIDAPPVLPVADVSILSELVDRLLFVVKAGKTPKDLVLKALKTIPSERIAGIILNCAETSSMRYLKYYGY